MRVRVLAMVCLLGFLGILGSKAQDAPSSPSKQETPEIKGDPKVLIEDTATRQAQLKRAFESFRQRLVIMAGRLENGTDKDKEKAKGLRKALKLASELGTEAKFDSLIRELTKKGADQSIDILRQAARDNTELRQDLQKLIALLSRDESLSNREEMEKNARLLEKLKDLIAKQERVRAQTDMGRKNEKELGKDQNKVTRETKDVVAKKGQGKEGSEGEDPKGKAKPDEQPGPEGRGEARGENTPMKEGKEGKEGKPGEGKEGKPGEGKEGKPGEGKEGKPGEGKEGKPGEGKEGKPGEGKEGKPGEGKEGKPGEGKEGKPGEGKEGKPGEGKPGKPGEGKPGEPKGQSKPGKPSDPKANAPTPEKPGGAKPSEGKPSEGKPSEGKPSEGKPSSGKPSPGKEGKPGSPGESPDSPPSEDNPVKKQIEEANKYQKQAEIELDKKKKSDASDNMTKAIKELENAKKKLEELLRQMREEEIEKLLADLEKRCRYMLALQIEVRDGTVSVDKEIQGNADKKPTLLQSARANKLADKEDEILREAHAALQLIKTEGSAVAFAEVFEQVSKDMEVVRNRLTRVDVTPVTQSIENDIIETLKEMVAALQKAQKEMKQQQGKPQQGKSGPQDQKLIDQIAELKMIFAMQKRVNARTELYGKQYQGEQAPLPESAGTPREREHLEMVQRELKDLATRQDKIGRVTRDIATGRNESK